MHDILSGQLVHLTADNPEDRAEKYCRWIQDTEMMRLLDTDPPRLLSQKKLKELLEKDIERDATNEVLFSIRTLDNNSLIGFTGLFDLYPQDGDTLVVIALGERSYWGKGYGTDAMRVMLGYAFNELNLRRVGLLVFEYNPRAIRAYEKAGFIHEGRIHGAMLRDGRRWDMLCMGILREEWLSNEIMIQ